MDDKKEEGLSGEFILGKKNKEISEKQISQNNHQKETLEIKGISKNKAGFLTSLCLYPKNIKFENQEKDENVVLIVRRALITNVPWVLTALILIFLPILIFLISDFITPFIQLSENTVLVLTGFYYLMIIGLILVEFTIWYFNVGLITTRRIVDLDLHGVLYKHVSETRLNLIEDVSYTKVGSVRSVFDYGDVHIQTAGTLTNFEFLRAPQPAMIVRIIADMIGGKSKWK